jgi:two-component system response regulator protein BraR/BceR
MYTIMIVEDDPTIASSLETELHKWHYDVFSVKNFHSVLEEFEEKKPQLILMDINLPTYNGYYWTQEIRKISDVPILFITSRTDEMDLVMAIQMGADDFIQKPFALTVVVAKVQALLRRTYNYGEQEIGKVVDGVSLKASKHQMIVNEKIVPLTVNETRIVEILFRNKGAFVSRERLMKELWENEAFIDDNTLAVNISRIRKKLREVGKNSFIETKKGGGYAVGRANQ